MGPVASDAARRTGNLSSDTVQRAGDMASAANHTHMMAIYFMHYNFVRIHQTLKITPAMAARLPRMKTYGREKLVKWQAESTVAN
jgi:hypothetical protein